MTCAARDHNRMITLNIRRPTSRRIRRLFVVLATYLAISIPLPANAAGGILGNLIGGFTLHAIGFFVYVINFIIGMIAGTLFTLAGFFVNLGIDLNNAILASRLLGIGFTLSLQVVNLGFVLAIIAIAFATILRYEQYGMKKMLSKLIIAAILVNFSLTIAGAILDFAGVFSGFFVSQSWGGGAGGTIDFVKSLAGAFAPQGVLEPAQLVPAMLEKSLSDAGAGILSLIGSLFFSILFTLIGAIVLLGIGIMIMLRYVFLLFLLVLMPFAWLGYAMPGLQGWWSTWWRAFLKWALFLPVVTFFFYLAIMSTEGLHTLSAQTERTFNADPGFFTGGLSFYGDMAVVLMFLIGGLVAGQKLGIAGAKGAMGILKAVKTGFIGKQGAFAKKVEGWSKGAAEKMGRTPGVRQLLRPISGPSREAYKEHKEEKTAEKAEELTEALDRGDINIQNLQDQASVRRGFGRGGRERELKAAAAVSVLADLSRKGKVAEGMNAEGEDVSTVKRRVNAKNAEKFRKMGADVIEEKGTGKFVVRFDVAGKARKALKKELAKRKKKTKKEKKEKDIFARFEENEENIGKKADKE